MKPGVFLSFLSLLVSCQRQPQPAIQDREALVDAYVELLIVNEQFKMSDSTSTLEHERRIEETLAKYRMTKDIFLSQFQAATESFEDFRQFSEVVNKKLTERRSPH